ncbi:MAG: hypothetical protein WC853_08280 [Thermodesulfovibrionales bacterium]
MEKKKITRAALISASVERKAERFDFYYKNETYASSKAGVPIWFGEKPEKTVITPDGISIFFGKPAFKTICTNTKPGYFVLKEFFPPFPDKKYYEEVSFRDVLSHVREDIKKGRYDKIATFEDFLSSKIVKEGLESNNRQDLKEILRYCLSDYPYDFLISNLPQTDKLKSLFAKMIHNHMHGEKRDDAKYEISQILERPTVIKHSKKTIPPYLYLGGMRAYLHKIAKFKIDDPPLEFTEFEMAKFFSLSLEHFKKKMQEENRLLSSPEKTPKKLSSLVLEADR